MQMRLCGVKQEQSSALAGYQGNKGDCAGGLVTTPSARWLQGEVVGEASRRGKSTLLTARRRKLAVEPLAPSQNSNDSLQQARSVRLFLHFDERQSSGSFLPPLTAVLPALSASPTPPPPPPCLRGLPSPALEMVAVLNIFLTSRMMSTSASLRGWKSAFPAPCSR